MHDISPMTKSHDAHETYTLPSHLKIKQPPHGSIMEPK